MSFGRHLLCRAPNGAISHIGTKIIAYQAGSSHSNHIVKINIETFSIICNVVAPLVLKLDVVMMWCKHS